MAPIFTATTGVIPQVIDDERLVQLQSQLEMLELLVPLRRSYTPPEAVELPLDIDRLVTLLEPWQLWTFEEQIDLQEWIEPLNKIDACISYYIRKYPNLLLIGPVKRKRSKGAVNTEDQPIPKQAEIIEDVQSVPEQVHTNLCIVLRFITGMLLNASSKNIFNSVEELVDLQAAANDQIASIALEALCSLAIAPSLHRQQAPELQQHTTALHSSKTESHKRLVALARGWGSRGSGLGLYTCVTSDDSEFGQGALPQEAGELNFTFFQANSEHAMGTSEVGKGETDENAEGNEESQMVSLSLDSADFLFNADTTMEPVKANENIDEASKQKRRRVGSLVVDERKLRSSAELFFTCLQKAGGRDKIPPEKIFALLATIRLSRSFHCRSTRIAAVERRLRALIIILNANPSPEVLIGYFQAQPEICVELVDLLRSTVSSAVVSAASAKPNATESSRTDEDAIAVLANDYGVTFGVRKLAVEALTALVSRRDGTGGELNGVARHSNVLSELGVGKGQYLGLFPTLIRFSLASFAAFLSTGKKKDSGPPPDLLPLSSADDAMAFEIGMAFVQATKPRQIPRELQFERALEFIESVLTLATAIVSTPSGTAALTDCGLIPALLNTVTLESKEDIRSVATYGFRVETLRRFVTAQAVQILEGAIVTHSNALSAFHNLNGVEILTARMVKEICHFQRSRETQSKPDVNSMDCDKDGQDNPSKHDSEEYERLRSSRRVLLFGIVTCLTVVFHQESTSSSAAAPSGATELRKTEMTSALIEIIDHAEIYGGSLVSLIATLLSDVMNSDPHVVRHIHKSGLAESFVNMLVETQDDIPILPAVPELIMAIPNVLSALALTEDGAKAVKDANPFPALLRIFRHSKYAMPQSRCLLNEMTAIVGTGLDEIMRHVNSLRQLICIAIVDAMNKISKFGEDLLLEEEKSNEEASQVVAAKSASLENKRSCLMQYVLNFGQMLEQVLHTEDHCDPFISAGGLEALLKLYPYMMPSGTEFLSHISCLSCPSVSTLTHSTTEDSVLLAFKCIALRHDSFKLLQAMINNVSEHVSKLEKYHMEVRRGCVNEELQNGDGLNASQVLDALPQKPIYMISDTESHKARIFSLYLRQVVVVQFMTGLLANVIKASCQKSQETGSGWSESEKEWKKELSSTAFEELIAKVSSFCQSALFEVCRVRTQVGFEDREILRLSKMQSHKLRYRLRIVCPEGAVVRDGIDIDSCASVGSMEMGEVVDAFDRCVNSSGVLRYRAQRGWFSEQTRGHGREPIAEVLKVWEANEEDSYPNENHDCVTKGRVEAGVPDLRSTGANILARVQNSYVDLFSALARVVTQGARSLPVRCISFQPGTVGAHVTTILRILKSEISNGFTRRGAVDIESFDAELSSKTNSCQAMYFGCLMSHLYSCLFADKGERRMVYVLLLVALFDVHKAQKKSGSFESPKKTILSAMRYILSHSLTDFKSRASGDALKDKEGEKRPRQSVSRCTAASLPPVCSILRRLLSTGAITSSPLSSLLSRIKRSDFQMLCSAAESAEIGNDSDDSEESFSPEKFIRRLLCDVSDVLVKTWVDPRFCFSPAYVAHPIATLATELISGLEEATKEASGMSSSTQDTRDESRLFSRGRAQAIREQGDVGRPQVEEEPEEPSEDAINRLMEMGFTRDHALDAFESTGTRRWELALEYALTHPPPTQSTIQRRQAEREARRQRREQANAARNEDTAEANEGAGNSENAVNTDSVDKSDAMALEENKEAGESSKSPPTEDETILKARQHLVQWKTNAGDVVCDILSTSCGRLDDGKGEGDGETEALTVVLSSFLLEICERYSEQIEKIASGLFKRVKEQLVEVDNGGLKTYAVKKGQENGFAALCHASVLITRAFPNARKLVLKENLVHPLVSCIQQLLKQGELDGSEKMWPSWLSSTLLFLDIMAQPVVAFATEEKNEFESDESELRIQKEEHKKQTEKLSKLSVDVFNALYNTPAPSAKAEQGGSMGKETPSNDPVTPSKHVQQKDEKEVAEKGDADAWFRSVPAYFHLLPADCVESCVDICMKVISEKVGPIPPGVIHSTLLLMMRLLRLPSVSTKFAKLGAAENILSLTKQSRFTGHTGLVTLIFRRLLEDDAVLQATMENEIRSTVTRLNRNKEGTSAISNDSPSVSRRSFVQAITPLLCRDPTSFLKAVSISVRFEKGNSGSSDSKVTLLSTADRLKNAKKLLELTQPRSTVPTTLKPSSARRANSGGKQKRASALGSRCKAPSRSSKRRGSSSKSKKERHDTKEKSDGEKISNSQNPISHIVSLLIGALTLQTSGASGDSSQGSLGFESSFLWAADILEVLADLVLAIPACATAIHKYRPSRGKDRQIFSLFSTHALGRCPSPPRTFVSFMLHSLLPLDRRNSLKDQRFWNSGIEESLDKDIKEQKKSAFRRTKAVQSTARLLIALVARPGEGRRRVISELSFALSGGMLGLGTTLPLQSQKPMVSSQSKELHALQAWGELCIGLAAPRSNGSNYDGNSTLSFEVVRIMLESGMAHALLIAVHRVPLFHPMATATLGSLILPFEILSRPTVGDAVKEIVEKEKDGKCSKDKVKTPKMTSSEMQNQETSQRNDSFADDQMLEDAFGMEAARRQAIDETVENEVEYHEESEDEMDHMDVDEGIEVEEVDEEEDMSSSEESEESSAIEDSDEGDSNSDSESSDEEEDDDSEMDDDEEVEEDEEEVENDFGLGVDYGQEILDEENQEFDVDETDEGDGALDDGWTRIESSSLGGGMITARRNLSVGAGPSIARNRGIIDAAEEMIGTLLRSGEISGDALAEIEGSLGIRIGLRANQLRVSGTGGIGTDGMFISGSGGGRNNRGSTTRSEGIVGTVPHVHQRNQPDVGYTAFGFGGRWNETSPMEYVYGGPSMTACSRNYDLLSPVEEQRNNEGLPTLSQLDGRLFPGGPASATHSRTQNSSHPLLCGVDLPPINSLVSDLLPHGSRATRRGHLATRRPGDWSSSSFSDGGFLIATANGNIVRANRGNHGSLNSIPNSRVALGPVGWTDEGLPFATTVDQFSSTFERALGEAMAASTLRADQGTNDEPMETDSGQDIGGTSNEPPEETPTVASESQPQQNESNEQEQTTATELIQESSEGDRVASSLADGLRLSPRTEENMGDSGQNNGDRDEDVGMEDALSEEQSDQNSPTAAAASESRGQNGTGSNEIADSNNGGQNGLVCPPGMDADVFSVLPIEMQREVVEQARTEADLAAQLDAGSTLDLEALAALPEDMRREVIEQEQRERQMNETPADPANAEEMDNASFVASLAPDLRNEILLTADEAFLQSLPPDVIAEAQLLRERASSGRRSLQMAMAAEQNRENAIRNNASNPSHPSHRSGQAISGRDQSDAAGSSSSRRRQRTGKIRVERDREIVVYLPPGGLPPLSNPVSTVDVKAMLRLMYLLSPVRPQRLLQKVFQNLSATPMLRGVFSATFIKLLHDDRASALETLAKLEKSFSDVDMKFGCSLQDFPPGHLIGTAPEILDTETLNPSFGMLRRKQTSDTVASIAANLPTSARGSRHDKNIPPVVATRMVETLLQMCKSSPRFCIELLIQDPVQQESMFPKYTGFEKLLDLLRKPRYSKSSANLEQLLTLLEAAVSPLSQLSKHGEEEVEISKQDLEAAVHGGKEWLDVPKIVVSQERLQALCSILRMETCRDAGFARVNTIARRLCRIDGNRGYVLAELASVARALGVDAIRDLKSLGIRMSDVARQDPVGDSKRGASIDNSSNTGSASNSVAVSTSTSELKLLRVLQTLQALCIDPSDDVSTKKSEGVFVTEELVQLLRAMNLDNLWAELTNCLKIVQVLEGVNIEEDADKKTDNADSNDGDENEDEKGGKILQSSIAGLLTRFLPSIEAFFVANASSTRIEKNREDGKEDTSGTDRDSANLEHLVGGKSLVEFVTANKVLLNALVRTNASLLDRGLKALISVPRCRQFLDFDVKRQWFKTQVRRLRQQASRRHGSLRLHIRRSHVFEDAYHQLRLRNADEMRGRLHITFRNEDGVDAGGLSREFFGILSKEIFNPNYALFTSTEDGSTFQPNPNSSINPDHLSYFRFVGRIVGKAVSDGYLLDAHFTRSLYKHMLGIKPTHDDMEAIDPDYYKNLKTILEYNLDDLGLDLTFSTEDHSFGRTRMLDLLPKGRNTPVTEQNKSTYVGLICQHRMTTAIKSQIKAYLDGFYELVSSDLIQIFAPRELELLISGLPDIDVHDLKRNTDYVGWKAADKQIQWFWNVLFSLTRNQKASFLQFVTGSSKVPLAGFGELPGMRGVQKFSIHKASGSSGALMSAHTCFNSLDLPVYNSEEELKEKLIYAINEGGGTFLLA